jgi:PhnB protein
MSFHPYLFFGGSCRAAFTRYHEIFGGQLELVTTADMPPEEQMPGVAADLIMHAALIVDGHLLMGSDDPTTEDFGPVQGMQVNVSVGSVGEAARVFEALAEGGEVHMPLAPTSWSAAFGMLTDRFGTPWLLSADEPADAPS